MVLPARVYDAPELLWGVTDSKRLAPVERARWAARIRELGAAVGVAFVARATIDRRGIAEAARTAMLRALDALDVRPDYVVVDAVRLPAGCPYGPIHQALVKADARCLSVAAASICAKVARDAYMTRLDARFPGYGFARHKGYGTAAHEETLRRLGPCAAHRRSFAPVRRQADHALAALAR